MSGEAYLGKNRFDSVVPFNNRARGKRRKFVGLKIKKKESTKANAIIIKWPPIR